MLNKILIIAVTVVTVVALAGTASASVTFGNVVFTLDSITSNGHYVGTPVLENGDLHKYGYEYTFVFDGTYTLKGHATSNNNTTVIASVDFATYNPGVTGGYDRDYFTLSPGDSADFTLTINSRNSDCDSWVYVSNVPGHGVLVPRHDDSDIRNSPDTMVHTIDQGPMSDGTAIFTNGVLKFTGNPMYMVSLGIL